MIITYKRANQQATVKTLRRNGYTGDIYLIVDDSDPQLDTYKKLYGENVLVFSKAKVRKRMDTMVNSPIWGAGVYARNFAFRAAKKLGYKYFVSMDDDYSGFYYKVDGDGEYANTRIQDLDRIIKAHVRFLVKTNISCVAWAQGGDFQGGEVGQLARSRFKPMRKMMNVFFFRTDRPIKFSGVMNGDSVTGLDYGRRGHIILTNCLICTIPIQSQTLEGGLTDLYKEMGTYSKSFFSVLMNPSATKVAYLPDIGRVHHVITGRYAYPLIVSEKLRKK